MPSIKVHHGRYKGQLTQPAGTSHLSRAQRRLKSAAHATLLLLSANNWYALLPYRQARPKTADTNARGTLARRMRLSTSKCAVNAGCARTTLSAEWWQHSVAPVQLPNCPDAPENLSSHRQLSLHLIINMLTRTGLHTSLNLNLERVVLVSRKLALCACRSTKRTPHSSLQDWAFKGRSKAVCEETVQTPPGPVGSRTPGVATFLPRACAEALDTGEVQ